MHTLHHPSCLGRYMDGRLPPLTIAYDVEVVFSVSSWFLACGAMYVMCVTCVDVDCLGLWLGGVRTVHRHS